MLKSGLKAFESISKASKTKSAIDIVKAGSDTITLIDKVAAKKKKKKKKPTDRQRINEND